MGKLERVWATVTILCGVFCVLAYSISNTHAQDKATWPVSDPVIYAWFAAPYNVTQFKGWAEETLTQDQLDSLCVSMRPPDPPDHVKEAALKQITALLEDLQLPKDDVLVIEINKRLAEKEQERATQEAAEQAIRDRITAEAKPPVTDTVKKQ